MLTNDNYFVVQGYMRTELGLKGNELMLYAIINGFSQTEDQRFTGSLSYLAEFLGTSKQTIITALASLVAKGYIVKNDVSASGVKKFEYVVKKFDYSKNLNGVVKNFEQGGQKILPIKINDNKEINNNTLSNAHTRTRARVFEPPTVDEVAAYCKEKGYTFDPESFVAFYASKDWYIGKNKMKSWHDACVTWQKRQKAQAKTQTPKKNSFNDFEQHSYDFDSLEDQLFKKMQGRK